MLKLSRRLQKIADYVTEGSRIADIGSDHAMLPVYLLQSNKCPSGIAGELNEGPYEAARKQAADAGLSKRLAVRQGDGLAVLQPGEADTVTIAGMGGSLMSDILEAGAQAGKLSGVQELVLQPNVGEDTVRRWLRHHGWYLAEESILEEDGKIYEIMRAVQTPDAAELNIELYDSSFLKAKLNEGEGTAVLFQMGPHLLRRPTAVLRHKWRLELEKQERICKQLAQSELAESERKLQKFRAEMNVTREVLQCLPTDIPSSN
ncbi:tRNA (adenine(22)-N(1))-methyltransferase [Paenibacillus harenae]|uniref:tRNA (adenine(22)-N(1))-methyltransferase n=1 Tax=Paenibacillus harenae TaxID=306543 RepID=UPI002794ACE0|nr:class I SAM-dependent methyltransferase [Paenibacillus harenae]MDQ0058348.1 tRNA (adenine22-N1)-methyltransferase [Paenibacillus harenae]